MDNRNLCLLTTCLAFSAMSCGDAVPPPGEGAVVISTSASSAAPIGQGFGCDASTALVWANNDVAPSTVSAGELLVDGRDGAGVSCTVSGGGPYTVRAEVSNGGSRFALNGTVNADGKGTAYVEFWDPKRYATVSDPSCTIETGTGNLTIASGSIWATVNCSNLKVTGDAYFWCAARAVVVFKSCGE